MQFRQRGAAVLFLQECTPQLAREMGRRPTFFQQSRLR